MAKKDNDLLKWLIPGALIFFLLGPEGVAILSIHPNNLQAPENNTLVVPDTSQISVGGGGSGSYSSGVNLCSNLNSYIVNYGADYKCGLIGTWVCNSNEVSCSNIKVPFDCNLSMVQNAINFCNNNGGNGYCDSSSVSCKI